MIRIWRISSLSSYLGSKCPYEWIIECSTSWLPLVNAISCLIICVLFLSQSVRRDVSGVLQICRLALVRCVCGVRFPECCCWEITVYRSAHPNTTGDTEPVKVREKNPKSKNVVCYQNLLMKCLFKKVFYKTLRTLCKKKHLLEQTCQRWSKQACKH